MYYLIARYYDPTTGRFISIDPQSSDQSDPLSQNLYLYTRNNPVMYADPDGNWFIDAAFLVVDIAEYLANPTLANATMAAADAVLLVAEPTGTAALAMHGATGAARLADTYNKIRKFTKGKAGVEAHHTLEKRFIRSLDVEKHGDMLAIGVAKDQHQVYTNRWRFEFPYGKTELQQSVR